MIEARTEVVGSLLRPPELLAAQRRRATGDLSAEELAAAEDLAVDWALALQEEAGLEVVTDGEMRRLSFQSQLPAAVDGFAPWDLDAFCGAIGTPTSWATSRSAGRRSRLSGSSGGGASCRPPNWHTRARAPTESSR